MPLGGLLSCEPVPKWRARGAVEVAYTARKWRTRRGSGVQAVWLKWCAGLGGVLAGLDAVAYWWH